MDQKYRVVELHNNKDCANFTKEGMEGVERKNPNRPVSLISLDARQSVNQATLRGLCYKKFNADITIDCDEMPDTATLIKSGDLVLGILPERKRCWPECELLEKKLPCPLLDGVRYAWVDSDGSLCLGDVFQIVETGKEGDLEVDED